MTTTINHSDDTRHHAGGMDDTIDPDPEVPERAKGPRRFPAAYKARILAEYETLGKAEKGALLRREGLYSSLLTEWRRQSPVAWWESSDARCDQLAIAGGSFSVSRGMVSSAIEVSDR
jgi:hypothetical protein